MAYAQICSDDLETQTGVVILDPEHQVAAVGANRLPPGVARDGVRQTRPEKPKWIPHAEVVAIVTARKDLRGHTLVMRWFPCARCAQIIALAGLTRVVASEPDWDHPDYGFREARRILHEAGVEITWWGQL